MSKCLSNPLKAEWLSAVCCLPVSPLCSGSWRPPPASCGFLGRSTSSWWGSNEDTSEWPSASLHPSPESSGSPRGGRLKPKRPRGRPDETLWHHHTSIIHREEDEGPGLTQLVSAEAQTGRVLVQVLVEVDAQVAQLLLDGLDFLLQQREGQRLRSEPAQRV